MKIKKLLNIAPMLLIGASIMGCNKPFTGQVTKEQFKNALTSLITPSKDRNYTLNSKHYTYNGGNDEGTIDGTYDINVVGIQSKCTYKESSEPSSWYEEYRYEHCFSYDKPNLFSSIDVDESLMDSYALGEYKNAAKSTNEVTYDSSSKKNSLEFDDGEGNYYRIDAIFNGDLTIANAEIYEKNNGTYRIYSQQTFTSYKTTTLDVKINSVEAVELVKEGNVLTKKGVIFTPDKDYHVIVADLGLVGLTKDGKSKYEFTSSPQTDFDYDHYCGEIVSSNPIDNNDLQRKYIVSHFTTKAPIKSDVTVDFTFTPNISL